MKPTFSIPDLRVADYLEMLEEAIIERIQNDECTDASEMEMAIAEFIDSELTYTIDCWAIAINTRTNDWRHYLQPINSIQELAYECWMEIAAELDYDDLAERAAE